MMRGSSHNPTDLGQVKKLSLYLRGGLGGSLKKKKKKIHVCCVQFPIANIKYLGISFHILLGSLIRLQYEGLRSNVTCLMSPNLWRHVTRHESAKQLCIPFPATSASSERTFSSAGRVLESRCNRLNPGTVDAILFLHSERKNTKCFFQTNICHMS